MKNGCTCLIFLVACFLATTTVQSFTSPSTSACFRSKSLPTSSTTLFMNDKPEFNQKLQLREEAESPFRKVRFFIYASLAIGAATSLVVSTSRIAAAAAGINTDLMQESLINAGVDTVGLIVLAVLFQRDVAAQESRLKRASKGAEVAKLMVRGSKSIISGGVESTGNGSSDTFTASLADMRRGRGIEKRVVIAAGGPEKIAETVNEAKKLTDSLELSDLLIVPVVMPQGAAPAVKMDDLPDCVALPVGNNWKSMVDDEAAEAVNQGVDIVKEGFCVILKKNGRIGQRTRGIFLGRMVGEVTERSELGMDVTNI